ncbi:DUF5994 family protein [Streptomyces lincolnensis]|uniref:DUF5994 family protein n=1 Tax=Streptomyces lincolnensis TaxID=1915 RepID=UPI0027E3361E|nr:DUF5994 family protein [Streptomyces lincolnensis]
MELPRLLAWLPRAWGRVTSVTAGGAVWSAVPGRMLVSHQVVRLRGNPAASAAHAAAAEPLVAAATNGRV